MQGLLIVVRFFLPWSVQRLDNGTWERESINIGYSSDKRRVKQRLFIGYISDIGFNTCSRENETACIRERVLGRVYYPDECKGDKEGKGFYLFYYT